MDERRRILVLMVPPTAWLVALLIVPIGTMAAVTFHSGTFGPSSQQFSLETYRTFIGDVAFHRLLLRSFGIALIVSALTVILSYPVAYFLSFQAGAHRVALLTALIIPAWTSYLLRVLAWKIILGPSGVLNSLLQGAGLTHEALPVLLYNRWAVIITLVYSWIPFVALPIFAALERIDRSLLESAADLGAARWQTFLRITVPLSLPGVIAGFLFVFIPTVGEYVTPSLVGGPTGVMYGNIIQDQFLSALNWPMGSLMSMALLIAVLLPLVAVGRNTRLSDLAGF
jgi:spermidine/putrescine transport system permease protein